MRWGLHVSCWTNPCKSKWWKNPIKPACRSPRALCAGNTSVSPTLLNVSSHICEALKHLVSFREPPKSFALPENHKKQITKKTKWRTALQWNFPILCKGVNSCFASLSTFDIRTSIFTFPVLRKNIHLFFIKHRSIAKNMWAKMDMNTFLVNFRENPKWNQSGTKMYRDVRIG